MTRNSIGRLSVFFFKLDDELEDLGFQMSFQMVQQSSSDQLYNIYIYIYMWMCMFSKGIRD